MGAWCVRPINKDIVCWPAYLNVIDCALWVSPKARSHNQGRQVTEKYNAYVVLDVCKDTTAVAVACFPI
jgi:hypothetical protein